MDAFRPIGENCRLSEKVFEQIIQAIQAGRYQPSDKLPSENELANMFKVSRTSVREAMKMLLSRNLVVVKRGLGAFVNEFNNHSQVIDLQNIISRERDNILELFQIRKILETEAAASAAQAAQPADLEKMEKLLSEAEQLVEDTECDVRRLSCINTDFHYALVEATGNRTLLKVMTSLIDSLHEGREITLHLPGRVWGSLADHRRVFEAIQNGDSQTARTYMAKHLETVETMIKNMD
jgi:GntR family transcriptional repressor for pyruvate dehydrogenase complex